MAARRVIVALAMGLQGWLRPGDSYFRGMARSPRTFVLLACGCAVAFLVLLVLAYASHGARNLDATALSGFLDLQRPAVETAIESIAALGNPAQVGLMAVALAVLALARGRPRIALAIIVLLGATSISSQVLKTVLAYPRFDGLVNGAHVDPAAFPSGHATAAMSIALAGVLAAPSRARPLAALLGSALALGVGFSVIALGWHFPSDVVGGFLLASAWTLVIASVLQAASERFPERSGRTRATRALRAAVDGAATLGLVALTIALLLLVAMAGVLVLTSRPDDLVEFAGDHTSVVAVGLAIALAATALLAGVTAALRHG